MDGITGQNVVVHDVRLNRAASAGMPGHTQPAIPVLLVLGWDDFDGPRSDLLLREATHVLTVHKPGVEPPPPIAPTIHLLLRGDNAGPGASFLLGF